MVTRTQNGDSDVCRRCSFLGPTCCRIASGSEEFCFPLSLVEKERIREHVPYTGGFVLSPNSKAFIDYVCRLFPGEEDAVGQLFPHGKEHFRLAVDSLGACRFLGPLGCEIPQEVRPYYCRLFPFWMAGNVVTHFDTPTCLARREGGTLVRILDILDMNKSAVKDLYGRLRLVWGLPPSKGASRVKKSF
ncbi:zinc/iron-chelating domain-containing protein [Pseudodesulfovibrio sp. S3-i]|uniref:zinc/iron-chelating domain-containing protein n=1 Tax=unclassified Pseudodesulfovibrio TaxID=2661612 RepID=UPI0013E3CC53|nr:zinc/iron-chelating domain-containing protein [Pseudodesulfovibrio sp. S3-i]